jgi:hypothetical protein
MKYYVKPGLCTVCNYGDETKHEGKMTKLVFDSARKELPRKRYCENAAKKK